MRITLRILLSLIVFIFISIGLVVIHLASGAEPTYVGSAKCKLCHMKPHKAWNESRHAKAFEVLKPAEQKDPNCLICHVTGYQATQAVRPETVGVQCEACHGPASGYMMIHAKDKEGALKAGLIATPGPDSCKSCHNEKSPTFKGFNYAKMWEQINHPK